MRLSKNLALIAEAESDLPVLGDAGKLERMTGFSHNGRAAHPLQ